METGTLVTPYEVREPERMTKTALSLYWKDVEVFAHFTGTLGTVRGTWEGRALIGWENGLTYSLPINWLIKV